MTDETARERSDCERVRYPVGTKVRVSWGPAAEGDTFNGIQKSWKRVPMADGVTGELAVPKPHQLNQQADGYVWVKLDPEQNTATDAFSPGGWNDEGEYWELIDPTVREDDLHERIAPAIGYTCVCMDEESAKAGCDCYDIGVKAERARILSILEAKRKWHVEHFHAYEVGSTPRMLAGQSAETLRLAIDDLAREGENPSKGQGAT